MKVDTMRKIDRWVGIPLCFFLSIIKTLLRPLERRKKPKNVLFIELSEMGSTILADPAMRFLKDKGLKIHFVIFKRNEPSLKILKTVPENAIFSIRESNFLLFTLDTLRFIIWTRKMRIDTVIDLELFSRFTAILTALSPAPNRVGFFNFFNEGLYRGNMLTHRVEYNPHIHISKNYMALVRAAVSESYQTPYLKEEIRDDEIKLKKVNFKEKELAQIRDFVKSIFPPYDTTYSIILINPNASDLLPQRRWPETHFSKLIKLILKKTSKTLVLITGSASERERNDKIATTVSNERCINISGMISFEDLIKLYTISTLMISNDSGPPHFASVTDLHTYVLFGPETPELYGALGNSTPIYANLACSPCVSAYNHRKTPCTDNICLKTIKPEYVFSLIEREIDES